MKTIFLLVLTGLTGIIIPPSSAAAAEANRMSVSTDNLYRHVEFLTSIAGYRHYANMSGLLRCVDYIRGEFDIANGRIALQDFQVEGKTYQNIICSLGPADGPRIIVGAHYDVCGPQPGADDNASAVAGLLEIARLMSANADRLTYRLDLVAYCLEEPPFFGTSHMGSYVHARSLRKQKATVKEMLCLEMIGFFSEHENSQS
ncbi:MAG: M28 family peptidase, partial [Desulfobacteraceae bacterium]